VFVVAPGTELDFVRPLPVGDLWGVGPATLAKLERLGVATVGDLADTPLPALVSSLGKGSAVHLHSLAQGHDDREVVPDQEPKSISHEETFATDLTSADQLRPELVRMSDSVAARLRRHGYRGRTVQLKVRYGDFTTVTRSTTLRSPTDRGTEVLDVAWAMLTRLPFRQGVRLIGVGVSNLGREPAQEQLSFDDPAHGDWDAANQAVDAIRDRFGARVIRPARLAGRPERSQSAAWGPDAPAPSDEENRGTDRSSRG
jgi:DNA polymerase-4